ncbi:MAG TPA: hypothetical protein VM938_15095 [Acidimicrobiales bacterium]|nr:hypothetical protein [Acidimicrobiales bacterium]
MLRAVLAALVLAYAPATELCRLQDPAIDESSGVAASTVLWTHNDSGDGPRFYAVDDDTGATLGTFTVDKARAEDWEDMARGLTADGRSALFFADIGDNFGRRPAVVVYEVAEPADPRAGGVVPLVARHELRYDDGSHDAETLLVDPRTRALVVVTKDRQGVSGVYRAEAGVLRRAGEIRFDRLVRRAGTYAKAATAGDVAPDGRRVVVRTPFEAFEWEVGDDLVAAFARTPQRIALPRTDQGEAIAYTRDGRSLVTTTEGAGSVVHVVRGDRAVGPDLLAPRSDAQTPATDEDEPRRRRPRWPFAVAAIASALLLVLGGKRRRRRRRSRSQGRRA